jgi:hypothetical protein
MAAYLFSTGSILSSITLVIMFAGVGIFGPLNDAISALEFLFLIPVALAIYQVLRPAAPILSAIPTINGISAMLIFSALQFLLVARVVRFEQTLGAVLAMGAVIGVWMVVADALLLTGGHITTWPAWTGIVGGISFVITAIGWFYLGGMEHPAIAIGFIVGAISLPAWGIGLGRIITGSVLLG